MKTIGLIGGISWVSTVDYYRLVNEGINNRLGGLNFSQCIIYSFNYADIKKNNDNNDWDKTFQMILNASTHLKNAGAEAIVLCANTMHVIAERLEAAIGIPLLHIATATANAIHEKKISKVGLLGTKFTMELDFFKERLATRGIEVIIPEPADREFIHYTIFEELGRGVIKSDTRDRYLRIIDSLVAKGASGVILGCTEIPLLVGPGDVNTPVFDTTRIHAEAAIRFALG